MQRLFLMGLVFAGLVLGQYYPPSGGGGGGGATIPSVTNLISGSGSGNGADSGIPPATVIVSSGSYSNPGWIAALAATKLTGTVPCTQLPALTGDATTTAGACAVTVGKINGTSLAGLATGLLKITTSTGAPSTAVAGTDYAPATSGSGILKGSSGNTAAATAHDVALILACADSSGSATAQSCSTSPSITLAAKDVINYTPGTTNSGDLTVAVNGGSALHVRKWLGASVLALNDLPAGVTVPLYYDGTYLEAMTIGNAPSSGSAITYANGAIGSAPSCNSSLNEIYKPTDSLYTELDCLTGASSYTYFVGGVTAVPLTGFAWQNQSTATVSTTHGGENLLSAVGAGGSNVNGRYVSYPSAPFTRTLTAKINLFSSSGTANANGHGGMYISDGTKVVTFGFYYATGTFKIAVLSGTTMTNISTIIAAQPITYPDKIWLRFDDGVTSSGKRTYWYSFDGVNFCCGANGFYQEVNTTTLTATNIGYYAAAYDTSTYVQNWALGWQ